MSLSERGRTGSDVQLFADGVLGITTQNPESMLHSMAGLTAANGNTAFGVPFSLLFHFTHSTTPAVQTTTATIFSADAPFKFRVLSVKVRCVMGSARDFVPGYGRIRVALEDEDGSGNWTTILPWSDVGGMEAGDVKEFGVLHQATAIVSSDEGLRCRFESKADSVGENPTAAFVVEAQCLRVI